MLGRSFSLIKAVKIFAVVGRKKIENSLGNDLNIFRIRVTIWQRKSLGFDAEAMGVLRVTFSDSDHIVLFDICGALWYNS